jgi:hypothetical protein
MTSDKIGFKVYPITSDAKCGISVKHGTLNRVFGYTFNPDLTCGVSVELSSNINGHTYILKKLNLTSTTFNSFNFQLLDSHNNPTNTFYPMKMTGINSSSFSVVPLNGYLPAGKFLVSVHSVFNGYAAITPSIITRAFATTPTIANSSISTSFKGGYIYTISGGGFIDIIPQNN